VAGASISLRSDPLIYAHPTLTNKAMKEMKPYHFIVTMDFHEGPSQIIGVFPYFTAADNFLKNHKGEGLSAQVEGWAEGELFFETTYSKNEKNDFVRNLMPTNQSKE
jgi:hypothetical protein